MKYQKIGNFMYSANLPKKSLYCLRMIESYYTKEKIETLLYPIASKTFGVSCRTLEYACVNYAKKRNVGYCHEVNGSGVLVNLATEYDRWLNQWNRQNFDFFRRYARIRFLHDGQYHTTTVGQAHIIYWADKYGVIDYVRKNKMDIVSDMSKTHCKKRMTNRQQQQRQKDGSIKRKRQRLVSPPKTHCSVYETDLNICIKNEG